MLIVQKKADLEKFSQSIRNSSRSIGFIPTMGALHEGHISLIQASLDQNLFTICSIFVNPTQFNNAEDFALYPKTLEKDINILRKNGCHLLYLPQIEEIYPEGIEMAKRKVYDLNGLDTHLEGAFRPGHFQGVAMVVHRLLQHVQPQHLFMGSKDYQQCQVVATLIEKESMPIILHQCPTLRESNGLAMSSRNQRLSDAGKDKAGIINQVLSMCAQSGLKWSEQYEISKSLIEEKGLELEHLILADARSLEILNDYRSGHLVILCAAFCENVRLIDNIVFTHE